MRSPAPAFRARTCGGSWSRAAAQRAQRSQRSRHDPPCYCTVTAARHATAACFNQCPARDAAAVTIYSTPHRIAKLKQWFGERACREASRGLAENAAFEAGSWVCCGAPLHQQATLA